MVIMATPNAHTMPTAPSDWIVRFAGRVPADGSVLDLACGGGRHGRLFLGKGGPVTFLDKDIAAVEDLSDNPLATLIKADLEGPEPWPLQGRTFDGVIVANYLWRPLLQQIVDLVAPGGVLLYETFANGNEAFGRPRNPDFLLRSGELLEAARGQLEVLAYAQFQRDDPRPAVIQHIAARRA